MYFSLGLTFASLLFLTSAAPPAKAPASRGIAVPITKRSSSLNGVVDTSKVQSGVMRSVAKIQEGFARYERNTGKRHPLSGDNSLSRRATGSEPLTDFGNSLWYGTISVGTPAVTFTVQMDTGSSDLFLPSTICGASCAPHKLYNPKASSTAKDLSKTFSLGFGDGSTVDGEQFTDVVSIAGLTAKSQTLGAATQESGFASEPEDGLMGLAFQSISEFNAPPVFQSLISGGVLSSPVFGIKLAANGSELFLGGTNTKLYTGSFTWVTLTNQSFWQASFNSLSVNGKSVLGNTAAIFDSGTAKILGDSASITKLFAAISGSKSLGNGAYSIPCTFNTPISMNVGGKAVSISPASFNLGPVSQGSTTCLAGAGVTPDDGGFWILGDVFLQNVYTAWDVGNSRIGFATLA